MGFHDLLAGRIASREAPDGLSASLVAALHNKQEARRFLETLDPSATKFTFQFFRDDGSAYAKTVHDTLDAVWPYIERENVPGRNMGVFVTINETDGRGRKSNNIKRARALFVDADCRAAVERCGEIVRGTGANPTAIVKTSEAKAHFYWCVDDLSLDEFTALQAALSVKFGTDPTVKDLPRVMRLPGTLHLKSPASPNSVCLVGRGIAGRRWSRVDLVTKLGLDLNHVVGAPALRASSSVFEIQESALSARFGPTPARVNDDLSAGIGIGWFVQLPPHEQNECLRTMLNTCDDIAAGRRDEWLRIMIAAHASGAPDAEDIALQWCKTGGEKFRSEGDFQKDWNSFGGRSNGITVGTLIQKAEDRGFDAAPWKLLSDKPQLVASPPQPIPAGPLPGHSTAVTFGKIRHRQWLYGTDLVRGEITLLASPGGIGKSSLAVGVAVSVAAGKPLLEETIFGRELKALYINGEDSRTEMLRRIQSFCMAHGLAEKDLSRLHLLGSSNPETQSLSFLRNDKGASVVDQTGFSEFRKLLSIIRPDVIVLDPLVVFCGGGNVNDNAAMSGVLRGLKHLANEYDCAILVIHHTKKGADLGSAEAIGGASAIVNLARRALMAVAMSDDEARKLSVLPSQRGAYFRTVASKSNLSPRTDETPWYELTSVELPNAEPPTYLHGDRVQAVRRVQLSSLANPSAAHDHQIVQRAILDTVSQGKLVDGQFLPYSPSVAGANNKRALLEDAVAAADKAVINASQPWKPQDLRAVVEQNIKAMSGKGWLKTEDIKSGPARRGKGLYVNWAATPWAEEHDEAEDADPNVHATPEIDVNFSVGPSGK